MTSGIFLLSSDRSLSELSLQPYDSERLLQELLAEYPSLMAGALVDPEAPRRWLLIRREIGVPDQEDGAGRWALDHLFVDQDAVPTLVEVKRSSDSRIRREVVGQMLDYAANCVVYWPAELIRSSFEERCQVQGLDPAVEVAGLVGSAVPIEEFWERVRTNLQAGRVRLLFISDHIPPELRRIVEFLNQQMDPAEVLAIEIQQYVGGGVKGLVPRIWGATQRAEQRKRVATGQARRWTEETLLAAAAERSGSIAARIKKLTDRGRSAGARIDFGSGQRGSAFITFDHGGHSYWPFAIYIDGVVEVPFQWMKMRPAFATEECRRDLQQRLNAIAGIQLPDDRLSTRPGFDLASLDEQGMDQLLDVWDWFRNHVAQS